MAANRRVFRLRINARFGGLFSVACEWKRNPEIVPLVDLGPPGGRPIAFSHFVAKPFRFGRPVGTARPLVHCDARVDPAVGCVLVLFFKAFGFCVDEEKIKAQEPRQPPRALAKGPHGRPYLGNSVRARPKRIL